MCDGLWCEDAGWLVDMHVPPQGGIALAMWLGWAGRASRGKTLARWPHPALAGYAAPGLETESPIRQRSVGLGLGKWSMS